MKMNNNIITCFKIALIQAEWGFLKPDVNLGKAIRLIKDAAQNGAKLICLPEGFSTGYYADRLQEAVAYAETLDGKTMTDLKNLAKELGVFILAPIFTKNSLGLQNSAHFITSKGEILGSYSKSHPIGLEKGMVIPGDDYPIWNTELGNIGCLICYDACFPETAKILSLKGADLILVPAAWRGNRYYKEWWKLNIACRALDNVIYVAAVNHTGSCGDDFFAASSMVTDYTGNTLVSMEDGEGILYATIDYEAMYEERTMNTVIDDMNKNDFMIIHKILKGDES